MSATVSISTAEDRSCLLYTSHTVSNPVPFIVVDERYIGKTLKGDGRLCDVAPTLLAMMGIPQPEEMTGKSLLPDA